MPGYAVKPRSIHDTTREADDSEGSALYRGLVCLASACHEPTDRAPTGSTCPHSLGYDLTEPLTEPHPITPA
jgi:hypothetical protein